MEWRAISFCKVCGAILHEDAAYCGKCGVATTSPQQTVLVSESKPIVAGWVTRIIAWFIDVIMVSIMLIPIKATLGLLNLGISWFGWGPFTFGVDNVFYFLYWTYMEGTFNQSIGKRLTGIKVTKENGAPLNIGVAALESLGKAFLLPLDCLLGWILYPTKNQRLFNYLSDTTVIY